MKYSYDCPVYRQFYLRVADGHELYVEEAGNPEGQAVVFLHGGPGGSITPQCRQFFDPEKYHLILFDQRGTGKSRPFLSLHYNTPQASVEDMEVLRSQLGLEKWILFGGSYGSTLALLYAIHHPERVEALLLRGIFLGRQCDIDWLYEGGAGQFYPEEFAAFKNHIDPAHQDHLVQAYYQRLTSGDQDQARQAAKAWADWEAGLVHLLPDKNLSCELTPSDQSIALLEAHYFANGLFWQEDNYLLNHLASIQAIPCAIVHGRYDVDCRLSGAYELAQALDQAKLFIVEEAGHSPYDPPMFQQIVRLLDHYSQEKGFFY